VAGQQSRSDALNGDRCSVDILGRYTRTFVAISSHETEDVLDLRTPEINVTEEPSTRLAGSNRQMVRV
jgi:hypothetical protein